MTLECEILTGNCIKNFAVLSEILSNMLSVRERVKSRKDRIRLHGGEVFEVDGVEIQYNTRVTTDSYS